MARANYQLSDLPKFGDERKQDPQEFMYEFKHFLRYIELEINSPDNVEKAINLLGSCLHKKGRIWFENHVGTTPKNVHGVEGRRTVGQWEDIIKKFLKEFNPFGKTAEQLEFAWSNLKWWPQKETIEDFVYKVNQLAVALGKNRDAEVLAIKMAAPDKEVCKSIMGCTTIDEILTIINQLQLQLWLQTSSSQTQTQALAAQVMSIQDKSKFLSFQFNMEQFGNAFGNKILSKMDHTLTEITHSMDESYKGCCGCYPPCVKGCIYIRYRCKCTNRDKHSHKYVCQRCEESKYDCRVPSTKYQEGPKCVY